MCQHAWQDKMYIGCIFIDFIGLVGPFYQWKEYLCGRLIFGTQAFSFSGRFGSLQELDGSNFSAFCQGLHAGEWWRFYPFCISVTGQWIDFGTVLDAWLLSIQAVTSAFLWSGHILERFIRQDTGTQRGYHRRMASKGYGLNCLLVFCLIAQKRKVKHRLRRDPGQTKQSRNSAYFLVI